MPFCYFCHALAQMLFLSRPFTLQSYFFFFFFFFFFLYFFYQQASKKHATSFNGLLDYLTNPVSHEFHRDLLTVRAIMVWMSNQEIESTNYGHGTLDTPVGYLQLMKEKRATFAALFTTLCR